jgi:hypothetical protein
VSNSGASNGSFGSSNGTAEAFGTVEVLPVNPLLTEYAYTLTAHGETATTRVSSQSDAQFSFIDLSPNNTFPGVMASSSSSSTIFGTFGTGPFDVSQSGTLPPGDFAFQFSAFVNGQASGNGSSDFGFVTFQIEFIPIPEPGTMTLLGLGMLGVAGHGWLRRRRAAAS